MRANKVKKTVPKKSGVVLLEQEISHKNGFQLADQSADVFETRKVPIIILSAFLKSNQHHHEEFHMENKPLDKMQLNNKEQEIKKPIAQGEYGDKPFQSPKLDDKPADMIKKDMPKDSLDVDAGARNREENATKEAGKIGAAADVKTEPVNTVGQQTAK